MTAISAMSAPVPRMMRLPSGTMRAFGGAARDSIDGDDAAADIGAEHQHHAELDRHEAARGKRDDQQDRRDAGMEQPGHDGGEQEGGDRVARQIVDDDRQDLALAQRLGGFADQAQRQDEQADADQDAAELQQVAARGRHEQRGAGDEADRHQQLQGRS